MELLVNEYNTTANWIDGDFSFDPVFRGDDATQMAKDFMDSLSGSYESYSDQERLEKYRQWRQENG